MRQWMLVAIVILELALTAVAQPSYEVDGVTVAVSARGVIRVSDAELVGEGVFINWGPGWRWESACSWQDSWTLVGQPLIAETVVESGGYASCSYARLSWKVKMWIGLDSMLIELNVTAEEASELSGMAWAFYIPISRFANTSIVACLANGSRVDVLLRAEHVAGNYSIAWFESGVGWIVPRDGGGVFVAFLSDLWPQGLAIDVVDDREWGGDTYEIRGWLGQYLSLAPGQVIRMLVYIDPYEEGELEEAVRVGVEALRELGEGKPLSYIRDDIVASMRLEEARESRKTVTPLLYAAAIAAFVTLIAILLGYYALRSRRTRA